MDLEKWRSVSIRKEIVELAHYDGLRKNITIRGEEISAILANDLVNLKV